VVTGVFASEHHGTVKSGVLPIPGATVTATQGDKKLLTTTDDKGVYTFADLADGIWSIRVEMLGFANETRDIGVAPDAPSPEWDLKLMTQADMAAAVAAAKAPPPPAPAAPATTAAAAPAALTPVAPTAIPAPAATTAEAKPSATPATPAAPATAAASAQGRGNGRNANQGGRAGGRGGAAATDAFQQVGVNQSADVSIFGQEGALSNEQNSELQQSANQAMVIQGSESTAMGLPGGNDWGGFGGPGGMGGPGGLMGGGRGMGGPDGMGGPGGMMGMTPDAQGGAGGADASGMGGAGAAGGIGGIGGMGGGRGGGGGGFGGGGGRGGGGGFGGGGFGGGGGRGGGGGGRGGAGGRGNPNNPSWMAMNGARAFGNARRNPRMAYNGGVSIQESNSLLNAQTYSLSGQEIPKPYSNRTTTTITLGGPLRIPHILNPQRMGQFNLSIGLGFNRNGSQGSLTTMPSALERQGNFSASQVTVGSATQVPVVYDPTTGSPFPNDMIPSNRQSPIAEALLNYYPLPMFPTATRNFQLPLTSIANSHNINGGINQQLDVKNRINVRVGYQGNSGNNPNMFGFLDTSNGRAMNINTSYTHNFTNRLIATLNYVFSRNRALSTPYFANRTNVAAQLGIQGVSTEPLDWGPPTLSFTDFAGLSDGTESLTRAQTSSLTASLMWIKGMHNFSYGASYRRQQNNRDSDPNGRGSFNFNGYATSQLVANPVTGAMQVSPGTGFDMADFLLATPYQASVRYGEPSLYFRGSIWQLYVQDDWRLTTRLSLNYGIRWDYQTPVNELNNQLVNLAFGPNFTSYQTVLPGEANCPAGGVCTGALIKPDMRNISPRLGLAWRPSAKRSTVIRAGYGWYYNSSVYSSVASNMAQQPPLDTSWNLYLTDGPLSMGNAFVNPAARATNTLQDTFAVDPNYRNGYAQQWQLSVQQNLPFSLQAQVAYQGTKGTNLDRRMTPWVEPPGSPAAPYPTGYTYETTGDNSIYNAVSAVLMRRFRGGLSSTASYQFAKMIDGGTTAQNWMDFRPERAVTGAPQTLNISLNYSTGQGRMGGALVSGWKGVILKDWGIGTTISMGTGSFLTVNEGGAAGATKGGGTRAEATGQPAELIPSNEPNWFFNENAFTTPIAGTWGNSGRDVIRGPFRTSVNGSANRTFRFGERLRMTFSMQASNILNSVVVTGWNTTLNSSTFGQVSAVGAMRTMSSGLRFNF
jgi:hypothetical protein